MCVYIHLYHKFHFTKINHKIACTGLDHLFHYFHYLLDSKDEIWWILCICCKFIADWNRYGLNLIHKSIFIDFKIGKLVYYKLFSRLNDIWILTYKLSLLSHRTRYMNGNYNVRFDLVTFYSHYDLKPRRYTLKYSKSIEECPKTLNRKEKLA